MVKNLKNHNIIFLLAPETDLFLLSLVFLLGVFYCNLFCLYCLKLLLLLVVVVVFFGGLQLIY